MSRQLSIPKSPFITRYEAIGFMFGQPLDDFNKLLPVKSQVEKPSTSKSPDSLPSKLADLALDMDKILPTDLDIINHWIFEVDRTRTTKGFPESQDVLYQVTDNLMKFWTDHTAIELRYVRKEYNTL